MKPKALILTVTPDTREMEELLFSLGYETVGVVSQNRRQPDPQFFLGRGKLDEARRVAIAAGVDLIAVNANLKPNQMFNVTDFVNSGDASGGPRGGSADAGLDHALVAEHGAGTAALLEEAVARIERVDTSTWQPPRNRGRAERVEVYDRLRVILEIFTERARSPEARLQVDLAKLQYEMPIVKEYIHLTKKGEHPGFLGGGEYEVNQYHDMMKKRIAKIRRDLDRISLERDVRRKHRRKRGFHLVSLAGYTNAGKSSLLRALAAPPDPAASAGDVSDEPDAPYDSDDRRHPSYADHARSARAGARAGTVDARKGTVDARKGTVDTIAGAASRATRSSGYRGDDILIENRYFSTLQTRTRRAESGKREILVTDTVGFIDNLPAWVVEAFHSTLEEIALADVILLVVDASDPIEELTRKVSTSLNTLWEYDSRIAVERAGRRRRLVPQNEAAKTWPGSEASRRRGRGAHSAAAASLGARSRSGGRGGHARANDSEGRIAASATPSGSVGSDGSRGPGGLAPVIVVMNKVDLVPLEELEAKVRSLQEAGWIGTNWVGASAHRGIGIDHVFESLYDALPDYEEFDLAVPQGPESESFVAWLHDVGDVLDLTRGNETHIHFEVKGLLVPEVERRAAVCGATPLKEAVRADGDAIVPVDAPSEDLDGTTANFDSSAEDME